MRTSRERDVDDFYLYPLGRGWQQGTGRLLHFRRSLTGDHGRCRARLTCVRVEIDHRLLHTREIQYLCEVRRCKALKQRHINRDGHRTSEQIEILPFDGEVLPLGDVAHVRTMGEH